MSKCTKIIKGRYDNGRIIGAEEIEIVLTDIDLKFIFDTHEIESYEFLEVYWAYKDYLPIEYIKFTLDKYENKTKYKNVEGKEIEYALEKANFNSLYGMMVTQTITDTVTYQDDNGWNEIPLTNEEIEKLLSKQKKNAFLSFSHGIFVTALARYNLLSNLVKLEEKNNCVIYSDTDSLKLEKGYDENVIKEYNEKVLCKLHELSEKFDIPYEKFAPKDKDGIAHPLGVFELDEKYEKFITQGAKKYAFTKWKKLNKVKDFENVLKIEDDRALVLGITVSGVPKKGAKALKKLEDFKDDFVFRHDDTGKNLLIYNDEQEDFEMTDFQGNTVLVTDRFGSCILPTTYELGKSQEYADLINENSAKIAKFIEGR